ncbi:LamG-like jellyroll fold domain-containing protein [Thomasclavelia sp.]
MKKVLGIVTLFVAIASITPVFQTQALEKSQEILPTPIELQEEYTYYESLSDEFNGKVSDMWLMDYMPWWSDTAKREKSGTETRYRFIDVTDDSKINNQSLQIYVNGENNMTADNFQPYYLEKLSGPKGKEVQERYNANKSQKNNWNSKFAGFMAGGKNYLNTYRGSQAPIEHHASYLDSGATTYGYFETRVKFLSIERGQGIAPAFWFIGMQDDIYDRGEVDVFEILDNHTLDFTIHPKGDTRIEYATKHLTFEEDLSKDYHTYGVLWDSTGFSLYIDGEFIFKHNRKIDYRMIPMFSINHHENGWIGSVDDQRLPDERTMDIDYYRVFKKIGTNNEPNQPVYPEMIEGKNVASAAYISLFGMTGTEVDQTPVQWLNNGETKNSVLSGLKDNIGNTLEKSRLPEYLYIDWKKPGTFNNIILHAQNAKSQAPTLVDVEISKDGNNWQTIKRNVQLDWQTDSQVAEAKKIVLDEMQVDNLYTRLVIKEANFKQGRFGLSEIEIGQNIEPMMPEYQELPMPDESVNINMKDNLFASWRMEDNLSSINEGYDLKYLQGEAEYVKGEENNGQALVVNGNTQKIYAPLSNDEKRLKSDEDFTLSMWINPDDVKRSDNDQIILAQQTGSPGGRPWLFIYNGTIGTYLGAKNTFGKIQLTPKQWQHVAVTFKVVDLAKRQGEVRLYVNGVLDTSSIITYEADSLADPQLLLGRHKNMSKGKYYGMMDNISLFNIALTSPDIKALYLADGFAENVKGADKYNATSVLSLPEVKDKIGNLTIEDIEFPKTVNVIFDNIYVTNVPVSWDEQDKEEINFNKDGIYTIYGELDFSNILNVTNSNNLKAEMKIILTAPINSSFLEDIFNQINNVDKDQYTDKSFEAFLSACQNVQTKETQLMIGVFPNYSIPEIIPSYVEQSTIDVMVEMLEQAIALLEKKELKINKTALQAAIAAAKSISQEILDKLVPAVVTEFKDALQEAEKILANPNAEQATVDISFSRLTRAIHMLEFYKGDKVKLDALINSAIEYVEENYTINSWAVFKNALDKANGVMSDENALEYEIIDVLNNLKNAIGQLALLVDKTELQEFYDKVSGLNMSLYTSATVANLNSTIIKAKSVLDNASATQEEINSAYDALLRAYLDLRLIPNKDLLQELINRVSGLNAANYTVESWNVVANAIENTKTVFANPEATQAEVDNAKNVLTKAIASLQTLNVKEAVKTGDDSKIEILMALGLFCFVGGLFNYQRKYKIK